MLLLYDNRIGYLSHDDAEGSRRRTAPFLVVAVLSLVAAVGIGDRATAAPTFTNVTSALGITHVQSATSGNEDTGGVAVGDFDGDGLVDLFFTRVDATDVLYRNTGSGFQNVSAAAGFTAVIPSNGVASGDVDNDGDLDLYVTTSSHSRYYLYINDGAGHFTEQAIARGADVAGPSATARRGMGAAFGDYDRDGYLDVLTTDYARPMANNGSRLLRNLGAANPGHFEDVTHVAGLDVYRSSLLDSVNVYRFQPQFADLDRDGHTDVLFTGDHLTSQLFWNNGDGTFTDGTVPAGVGTDKSGMGTALGDYDRDGDLDWFITNIFDGFVSPSAGNRFFRNNGNRTFSDVTTAAGVRASGSGTEPSWGWGTSFLDYDNDSDQDLVITDGWPFLGYNGDHTTLRRNNGNGTFTDVSVASGITDTGQGRGLVRLDFDADGDLDILIASFGAAPILYRNNGEDAGNWLRVKTQGTVSNRDGIGAWITVVPDSAMLTQSQVWEIGSGGSYLSQEEMTAHFGLGGRSGSVDKVIVEWTSGLVQTYVDVSVNSLLRAEERLLGDFNGDGLVDAADYSVWRDSLGMMGSGLAADVAGSAGVPDGVVDQIDYDYWLANFGRSFFTGGSAAGTRTVPEPGSVAHLMALGVTACVAALRLPRRMTCREMRLATAIRECARPLV